MRKTPYLFKSKEDITTESIRKIPLLNTKDINGFEFIKSYFVDSSGFGSETEPAITFNSFIDKIKVGFGYGIVNVGQFQVYINEYEPTKETLNTTEDLKPIYDNAKSFYNKAVITRDLNKIILTSYSTEVCYINLQENKPYILNTQSQTTIRHIKEFLKQNGFKADSSKQILTDYK